MKIAHPDSAAPRTHEEPRDMPVAGVQIEVTAQDTSAMLRALRHASETIQADPQTCWVTLSGTQGDGWEIF